MHEKSVDYRCVSFFIYVLFWPAFSLMLETLGTNSHQLDTFPHL